MRTIAIDPGGHCGVAVLDDYRVVYLSTIRSRDWSAYLPILKSYGADQVVVEAPPQAATFNSRILYEIIASVKGMFGEERVVLIGPGTWKPLKQVLKRPGDAFSSPHERDAVYLGRYAFRRLQSR